MPSLHMARSARVAALAVVLGGAAGCFFGPTERRPGRLESPSARWNGIMDTLSSVLLPDFGGERSWRRAGPVILPRAGLPACAPAITPGPDWQESHLDVRSDYLIGRVSVRLPARWKQSFPVPGFAESPHVSLVGTWHDSTDISRFLAIHASRHGGYSSIGVDSLTRQLALAECEADRPEVHTAIASFETVGWRGHVWHAEAVVPVGPSQWMQVYASTGVASEVSAMRAIVASVRFDGP